MKKRMKLLISLLAFVILVGCNANDTIKESDSGEVSDEEVTEIVLGAKEDGQPYIFKEGEEVKGFEAEMWEEIAKRNDWELKYEFNSISGLFGLLDNEKIDTITHFLGATEERAEKYDFSDTYAYAKLQFMIHNDTEEIKSLEELHGEDVGVALGSAAAGVIQSLDPEGKINLVPYEEFRNVPQDVELGRIKAYFGNTITMVGDIENMDLNCKINPLVVSAGDVAYPFRKNDERSEKIKEKLNLTLKEMVEDGTVAKISEKWFKIDVTDTDGFDNLVK